MMGLFGNSKRKQADEALFAGNCRVFHREGRQGHARVFIEVLADGDRRMYIANEGVTPAYLNLFYDDWCTRNLSASYVFADFDSAIAYFTARHDDMAHYVRDSISSKMSF